MKVRTDYVSNSSTSNFVLIGDAFSREDIEKSSFFKANANEDAWEDKCYELGLHIEYGIEQYYDQYVIGLRYADMNVNETKAAFHKRVEDLLKKAFPEKTDIDVGLKDDAGYNG